MFAVGFLTLLSGCGFEIVDTGYRGVKTTFGKVVGGTLDEGIHFYAPWSSNVVELDVRIQKLKKTTIAYTKDVQNVSVTFTVTYYPDKNKMHLFYQNIGKDWSEKILPQILEGSLKAIIGKYEAVELIAKRQIAVAEINELTKAGLLTKDIFMTNLEINNFDFNDAFEQAVEHKVIAIQNAQEAINKTVRIREEAKQKVVSAEAIAKSMRIRANALKANPALVQYEAVLKWDGHLPQYVMGGKGAIPFINLNGGRLGE